MQNRNESAQCHSNVPVTQRRARAMLENNQATPDASQESEVQSRPPEIVSQYPDEPDPDEPDPNVRAPRNVLITEGYTPPPRAMPEKSEKT